jgi:carbon-monoxide dehydrogenase small subunit
MAFHKIKVTVNGSTEMVQVPSNMTLLQLLRDGLVLTGTKNGCAAGECGACTVILNGEPVNSCMVLAVECDGAQITTVEGLAHDGQLDPIQQAVIEQGGVQCGFCTPGILISARALLDRTQGAHPSDYEIRDALIGNLCRCTGYLRIIDAVKQAADAVIGGAR